jgi:transglutaminase-like putative cysteine protease
MRPLPSLVLACLLLLSKGAEAQETLRYRQWIEGTESGGMELTTTKQPERVEHREWTQLERMGVTVRQELALTATKAKDGALHLAWKVRLSEEPLLGEADWSPKEPGKLHVSVKGGTPEVLTVPMGAYLWPGDSETALKEAARTGQPIGFTEFSPSTQQWSRLELQPLGPDPLPGFPDASHFHGRSQEGTMSAEVDVWISPRQGEVKQVARMAGLTVLLQRTELPPPPAPGPGSGFFERTLAQLPPHPFLPWIPEAVLRWRGAGRQELPQDAQQTRLGDNLYRVQAAAGPSAEEAAERPVKGPPSKAEAPFLAPTPLLQFQEPLFNGLLARLHPPPDAPRWELAKRVTSFVFEWITEKDMSVGFASAQEVARNGRGDCTEHSVLAIALLRKLGVPARGVVGWVGLGEVLGLHFWVEVKLGDRWVPVDPTFDEAPASALRLKLGTTDLADLGSIGWDTAALSFVDGAWAPEPPWAEAIHLEGDALRAPDGTVLRVPNGRWAVNEGRLRLSWVESHALTAVTHPAPRQLQGARLLVGSTTGRRGWWHPGDRILWMDLGHGRWLLVDNMQESTAFRFLDLLEVHH